MQCACDILYCHLWLVWLYHIFSHFLIKVTICGKKKVIDMECVLWFSPQFLSELFLILRGIERDIIIIVNTPSCKVLVILLRF
jgi:hypothetical protein